MKPLKLALLLSALVPLGGCVKEVVPTASVKPFCPAIKNICIKDADVLTEDTATAIEGNNLARAKLCGKPRACKV